MSLFASGSRYPIRRGCRLPPLGGSMRLIRHAAKGILLSVLLVAALPVLLAAEDVAKLAADAQEAFGNGKYDDAAIVYRSWAAAEPGSGPAHGGLVRSLLFAGKKPEAYEALAAAQKAAPEK